MGCVAASKSSVFTLNGGETLDQLDTMLATVTNGTVDDIEAQISLFQLARTNRQEAPTIAEQRKFRNLKILVLWLQKEQKFGRYCYYGCHCLPEGSHNIAQGGYGKPLDSIDGTCKRFGQCYKCLIDEHKDDDKEINGQTDCIGEEIGYAADLLIDDQTGKKSLQCSNKVNVLLSYNLFNALFSLARVEETFASVTSNWPRACPSTRTSGTNLCTPIEVALNVNSHATGQKVMADTSSSNAVEQKPHFPSTHHVTRLRTVFWIFLLVALSRVSSLVCLFRPGALFFDKHQVVILNIVCSISTLIFKMISIKKCDY